MRLIKYDDKCVRIVTTDDEEFEGVCIHNTDEYDEQEFGRKEESLQIENVLFYKSYIKKVYSLENHNGPYGKFTQKYGKLEEITVEDGISSIEDILFSEVPEHSYRLLLYMEEHIEQLFKDKSKIIELLKLLEKTTDSEKIKVKSKDIIDKVLKN